MLGQAEDVPTPFASVFQRVHELSHQVNSQSTYRPPFQRNRSVHLRSRQRIERFAIIFDLDI